MTLEMSPAVAPASAMASAAVNVAVNTAAATGDTAAAPPASAGTGRRPVRPTEKFFYTVPEAMQDEWAYAMPACGTLTVSVTSDLRNCIAFEEHRMCESSTSVELTNVLSHEKRRFMLLHHVFSTKQACERSRRRTLQSH